MCDTRLKVVCWTITSLGSSRNVISTAGKGRTSGRLDGPEDSYADSIRTNAGSGEDDGKSQGLEGSK